LGEHDVLEIWQLQLATVREVLVTAGIAAKQVKAVGITNQRETTLVWNWFVVTAVDAPEIEQTA
jgi:glycerol kinase